MSLSPRIARVVPLLLALAGCHRPPEPAALPTARMEPRDPRHSPESIPDPGTAAPDFAQLGSGQSLLGFRTRALYTDAGGNTMGARLFHERTGFVLAVLRIQSVPQGFLWVNSFPTSDMGEPHTQEHLLLGKGNKGRAMASLEDMSLGDSSAFTMQWRTCYHFNTTAGAETWWKLLEARIDALLHPDYTDEEIRREVRHFGVAETTGGSAPVLEEKGTVYNEMMSTFERPWTLLGRAIDIALYGSGHPLSLVSGGLPEAIRTMQPADIRRFHASNYQLANMGMVASFPRELSLAQILERSGAILDRLASPAAAPLPAIRSEAELPAPRPAAPGSVEIVGYPHKNAAKPGELVLAWAPVRDLDARERLLLELFVANFAGDETTDLYRIFVDNKSREMDLGATGAFSWVSADQGLPVLLGLNDVEASKLDSETIQRVRERVQTALAALAGLPDGHPDLVAFNRRLSNRVLEQRRALGKFVNSPPGFGFRSIGPDWMTHLDRLERSPGPRKSLVMKPELDAIEAELQAGHNPWRQRLAAWQLLGAAPFAFATRAEPTLLTRAEAERGQRLEAEGSRLQAHHGTSDPGQAIARFKLEYDAETRTLDALAARSDVRFLSDPPLTLDEFLDAARSTLPGPVELVSSRFESMTGATVGMALKLDELSDQQLVFLSALPELLTEVGVIENGKPVASTEMKERLRREVLGLEASFSVDPTRGRAELVVEGAGNDLGEARAALGWMERVLRSPDWRPENLDRIRDVVDQQLQALRNTMRQSEESWVDDPPQAWWREDDPLLLAADSFLTREHNAHRLRWLLRSAGSGAEREQLLAFLERVGRAGKGASRAELTTLSRSLAGAADPPADPELARALGSLTQASRRTVKEAAEDLGQLLDAIPDSSLGADWAYLCAQIGRDLGTGPELALAELEALRRRLLATGAARLYSISSTATLNALTPAIETLAASLERRELAPRQRARKLAIRERLSDRDRSATAPVHVGLVNPNTQGGVVLNSAPIASYRDRDPASMLDLLAAKLFAGGGAHSLFMRTWGAGLAYSNGIGATPRTGRIRYYAERCPELPQTLRFVVKELRAGRPDPFLGEYAIAQVFGESRAAASYERRGRGFAEDLADGVAPETVRAFRQALLELRQKPDLVATLFARLEAVTGRVLPGFGPRSAEVPGAAFFVIGPEKQFELYESYLREVEGAETRLHRLYPRDFWMPGL